MALTYKSRKRLALVILVIALPLYMVVAVNLVDWANAKWGRLPIFGELAVFVGLGVIWALPFKRLFKGLGQSERQE